MSEHSAEFLALVGRDVVFDVASPYVYLGKLVAVDHRYAILEDADAHDLRDSSSNREVYVLESKQHGIRANRRRLLVRLDEIISLSALADVVD